LAQGIRTGSAAPRTMVAKVNSVGRPAKHTLYEVLGLTPSATTTDVRAAYRRAALATHPDKEGGSKEAFQKVVHAFELLASSHARRGYDALLQKRRVVTAACQPDTAPLRTPPASTAAVTIASSPGVGSAWRRVARSKPDKVLCHALSRLRQHLAALRDAAERRRALESMDAGVRQALLAFMEPQPSPADGECGEEGARLARATGNSTEVSPITSAIRVKKRLPADGHRGPVDSSHFASGTSPSHGVVRLPSGRYRALALILGMRVAARCVPTLEQALEMHAVLVSAKHMVQEYWCEPTVLEARLRKALTVTCQEYGVMLEDLSPLFKVEIRANSMIGLNRRVCSRYTADLALVIQQRNVALAAKASGWPSLRGVWVDFMQLGPSSARGRGTQRAKTSEEAAAIADAAHAAATAHSVQKASRRVAQAGALVRRLLDARSSLHAACKAKTAREEQRRQRDARWRWMRDPRRTMDEILRGPPRWIGGTAASTKDER